MASVSTSRFTCLASVLHESANTPRLQHGDTHMIESTSELAAANNQYVHSFGCMKAAWLGWGRGWGVGLKKMGDEQKRRREASLR